MATRNIHATRDWTLNNVNNTTDFIVNFTVTDINHDTGDITTLTSDKKGSEIKDAFIAGKNIIGICNMGGNYIKLEFCLFEASANVLIFNFIRSEGNNYNVMNLLDNDNYIWSASLYNSLTIDDASDFIACREHRLINLSEPVGDNDATTKLWVTNYVDKAVGTALEGEY